MVPLGCPRACVSTLRADIASFICFLPFLHFGNALFIFLGIAADSLGSIEYRIHMCDVKGHGLVVPSSLIDNCPQLSQTPSLKRHSSVDVEPGHCSLRQSQCHCALPGHSAVLFLHLGFSYEVIKLTENGRDAFEEQMIPYPAL
ncbi:hypothetical protein STEG23_024508 [Scotinomys teguina]